MNQDGWGWIKMNTDKQKWLDFCDFKIKIRVGIKQHSFWVISYICTYVPWYAGYTISLHTFGPDQVIWKKSFQVHHHWSIKGMLKK